MTMSQASSRLEMMQARFQQKQMQEKEQKLLQLYDQQQQRAYQVVQRGSAGSTGSMSQQHSVTRTTTTTHTTNTSQGGKVRQMFDERRQTTVKGIDRSYPLEPLDNKAKRQIAPSNGHVPSKAHQNGTVSRQTVTVRRTARADVNSNVNGGKPIVSYHEEVSQESFGNGNEFGNENHNGRYRDGNHRSPERNGVHIEEALDDDVMERNRMLAKIHLMEYDKNLRHRINNDLNSEQFPEDLMIDVPDKLPRKPIVRKLSQAEARLERFKNANAKRSNAVLNNTTSNRPEVRKRSEPMFPSSRTAPRDSSIKSKTTETIKARRSATEPLARLVPTQSPEPIARKVLPPKSTEPVDPNFVSRPETPARPKETSPPVGPVKLTETKVVATVKRVTKSPEPSPRVQKSPEPETVDGRSRESTARTTTRRSFPSSPSKSPDIVTRRSSAGFKSPEPRPARRQKSQEVNGTSETKVATTECRGEIHDNSSVIDTDTGSPSSSPTSPKKSVKAFVIDLDGDLKEKEHPEIKKTTPRKSSAERISTPQSHRQSSPNASPSPRPPSALSTASSTTSSTRGPSSAEAQVRRMATKAKNPTRSPGTVSAASTRTPTSARTGPTVHNDALVACKNCGRRFAQDRVSLHEKICTKTAQKKRKQFDVAQQRVKGTELEAFAKKGAPAARQTERHPKAKKPEVKKSNWRRKHEDFINAIRSAKQVQMHLAAGGKLSDLPPPPVSDTSDYIQCPHCGRKFNQGAADRHIPKCATMMHNKPKPRAPPKPKR